MLPCLLLTLTRRGGGVHRVCRPAVNDDHDCCLFMIVRLRAQHDGAATRMICPQQLLCTYSAHAAAREICLSEAYRWYGLRTILTQIYCNQCLNQKMPCKSALCCIMQHHVAAKESVWLGLEVNGTGSAAAVYGNVCDSN